MASAKLTKPTIQYQLKLDMRPAQERRLERWLWHLTGVYNWTVKTIERDAAHGIYRSNYEIEALLNGHGQKLGIPSNTVQLVARTAATAWKRCFSNVSKRPRMKGQRNKLNSIPFRNPISFTSRTKVRIPIIGELKFHPQDVPTGPIRGARVIKRASGWYLCVFIAASPRPVAVEASGRIGIDPGFCSLVTLSSGEKVGPPVEMKLTAKRLAQSQRGRRRRLTARLLERQGNQRKDRNHKLSRRLVSENALIAWSKDSHRAFARMGFGRSVASAAHGELRRMMAYKSSSCGRQFIEVSNRYSTVTCSSCGQRTGPHGRAGLKVRAWECSACGSQHDRDVNAARNTLMSALGMSVERGREAVPGIAL